MIEQIKAAFAESTATLQTLRIDKAADEFFAKLIYEPGYSYVEGHMIPLISLADYRVLAAGMTDVGNLTVTLIIIPKKNYPTSSGAG